MTEEEIKQIVRELRFILKDLKQMKPEQVEQAIFAHNYGDASLHAMNIRTMVALASRQLSIIEKSLSKED